MFFKHFIKSYWLFWKVFDYKYNIKWFTAYILMFFMAIFYNDTKRQFSLVVNEIAITDGNNIKKETK